MYAIPGFPGVVQFAPFVGFEGVVSLNLPDDKATGVLHIAHTFSADRLALYDDPGAMPVGFLCTATGQLNMDLLNSFGELVHAKAFQLKGGVDTPVEFKSSVVDTGYQNVVFVLCQPPSASKVGGLQAKVSGEVVFKNPYGYLPAMFYGFMVAYPLLALVYFILLIIFSFLTLKYRREVLRMQLGILAVIFMGFVETTTWFFVYVVMNDTGGAACCPWRTDMIFAIVTNNFKRTLSALLVLAVALGWGVVRPRLSRRTTLILLILGFFYLGCLLKFDLVRMERTVHADAMSDAGTVDSTADDAVAFWALPVALIDVLLIFWIYVALSTTQKELAEEHQEFKLAMYKRLARTLMMWTVLWIAYTLFDVGVRSGVIPWPWNVHFMLYSFWDVLYLGILITIASVWRPSETSVQLAYSTQLPTDAVLEEFEGAGLEMPAASPRPPQPASSTQTGTAAAFAASSKAKRLGQHSDDADEEEGDGHDHDPMDDPRRPGPGVVVRGGGANGNGSNGNGNGKGLPVGSI